MEILFLPVHICISKYLKIQEFRRHHRTSCDDGGMVAKGNQAESHMISQTQCSQKLYSIQEVSGSIPLISTKTDRKAKAWWSW